MKKLFAAMCLLPALAWGQVNSGYVQNQVLSASSLNFNFGLAAAVTNGTLTTPTINTPTLTGGTITGTAITGGTITGATLAGGMVPLSSLSSQAANTFVANVTGSSASPTAATLPSCSATGNALLYTSGTGLSCGTGYALLASPTFTGVPAAPTAATNTNTTQLATTAFVEGEFASPPAAGLGSTTPGPVASTTLAASGTVSGAGFTSRFASPGPIGNTAASTGAFTTLSATGTVSGAGITALFSSPLAIGNTTPNTGAFTTLSASGAFTPAQVAGIVGTTTNNDAAAGSVGEFVTATGTGVSVPSSGTATNIITISLTAGDWDVWGGLTFLPAGTTTVSTVQGGISTASATLPSAGNLWTVQGSLSTGSTQSGAPPMRRITIGTTTTVYLVGLAVFGTSTMTATGILNARRVR